MDTPDLGALIRQTRLDRGLTERPTAKAAGISAPWLRRIEQGHRPSVKACYGLARALDLPAKKLLTLAGHPKDAPEPVAPDPVDISPYRDVVGAILSDTRLLPEARLHLANQYELLLRVQAAPTAQEIQESTDRALLAELDDEPTAEERQAERPPKRRRSDLA